MNKPGVKTTEFYVTLSTQVLSLLAVVGLINSSDQAVLGDAIGKAIAAAGVFLANAFVVVKYIQGRLELKLNGDNPDGLPGDPLPPPPDDPPPADAQGGEPASFPATFLRLAPILAILGLCFFSSPASAQFGYWRNQYLQRLERDLEQNRQDTRRIGDEVQRLREQLSSPRQDQRPQPSNPAPQPQIILIPPFQQLPISGQPRQELPVPGQPKQDLPTPGQPKQDLPPDGKPKQDLPPDGRPRQDLPERRPRVGDEDLGPIGPPDHPFGEGKPFLPQPGVPKPARPIAMNRALWR